MAKLCGIISPASSRQRVSEQLRAMAATMRHSSAARVEERVFDGAGLAVVQNPLPRGSALAASADGARALALAGHVVGEPMRDAAGLLERLAEHGAAAP